MISTSETGHIKNLAHYDRVVLETSNYGTLYNPVRATIKVPALTSLQTAARTAQANVNTCNSTLINARNAFNTSYRVFPTTMTRLLNSVKASDTTDLTDTSVKSIIRVLRGGRATPKPSEEVKKMAAAEGKEITTKSVSHISFDMRMDNFDKLIKLLAATPLYNPNEADLKVAALTTYLNDLKAKRLAVINAEIAIAAARTVRNDLMYKPNTGMVDVVIDVKNYVKSVFGASSIQYRNISKLDFKRLVQY